MSRAGFFTGILLLVVLSAVTDWTIRLIVTKAKLSNTKSYIGPAGALLCHFSNSLSHSVVRICAPRRSTHRRSRSTIGMCPFGIIIGASVLYLDVIPRLTSAPRGYDSACHPLHVSHPSFCTSVPVLLPLC